MGLHERRQNRRRCWSDEADAKNAYFPARGPLRQPFCLISPLQNALSFAEQGRARSGESNIALVPQEKLGTDFLSQSQNALADVRPSNVEATRGSPVFQVS